MNIDDYKTNDLLWDIKRIADALEKIAERMNTADALDDTTRGTGGFGSTGK